MSNVSDSRDKCLIQQLGYIGINSTEPERWCEYASYFLGMEVNKHSFRMDERSQRMFVNPSDKNGIYCLGFELPDKNTLDEVVAAVQGFGIETRRGSDEEKESRKVTELVYFHDPDGNLIEFYVGAILADTPVKFSRPIGGFRTGELGVGHVALVTVNFEKMREFYEDVLHFKLSDFIKKKPFRASFFHINKRHHTLAIIESTASGVHHIMIEYQYMDDIGRLHDIALKNSDSIAVTLGRHSNDHMFSFYSKAPGGIMLELGWGGRLIREGSWVVEELYGPSIWGHERSWLPPEGREAARQQLQVAADMGVLEPTEAIRSKGFNLDMLGATGE